MNKKEIREIIIKEDWNGFSVAVKWELKRYIVATTHNSFTHKEETLDFDKVSETLEKQVSENKYIYDNVTIWGWNDNETDICYIDAWMSTDDLDYALNVANYHNQLAIWDAVEEKEIRT